MDIIIIIIIITIVMIIIIAIVIIKITIITTIIKIYLSHPFLQSLFVHKTIKMNINANM